MRESEQLLKKQDATDQDCTDQARNGVPTHKGHCVDQRLCHDSVCARVALLGRDALRASLALAPDASRDSS